MSSNIPQSFYCPITKCIMTNPYIDNDGITYEYNAIKKWLDNNNTSPITRNTLTLEDLKPNRSLLDIIQNYNNTYTYITFSKFEVIVILFFMLNGSSNTATGFIITSESLPTACSVDEPS